MKELFSQIKTLLYEVYLNFYEDDLFSLSAALAYYTVFSLAPILVIIISLVGYLFGETAVKGEIFRELGSLIGTKSAYQIRTTIENIGVFDAHPVATAIGIGTLIFTATTVFVTIQNSLNLIFKVKAKPKLGVLKMLRDRALSFAIIVGLAFILLVSLIVNAIANSFNQYIAAFFPEVAAILLQVNSFLIPTVLIAFLFAIIFKTLPDAKLKWKDVFVGGLVTAVLFVLGKFLIGLYIGNSNLTSVYDAAGSIMVILLWVFYTSLIFFLGAEFTYTYAKLFGSKILPADYAVHVIKKEVEIHAPKGDLP